MDLLPHGQPDKRDKEGVTPLDQDAKSELLYEKILQHLNRWREKYPDRFWEGGSEAGLSAAHHGDSQYPFCGMVRISVYLHNPMT